MPGSPLDTLDASDGELLVHTAVTGRAARMGHRLTIRMDSWRATVRWHASDPTAAELTVDVDSFHVVRGEGGVTPLSGPEKALVRANALKLLEAGRFPQIRYHAESVEKSGELYRLSGTLVIHGRPRSRVVEVRVEDLGDSWRLSSKTALRQSEFGIKPYSMLMGAMKVADDVVVSLSAEPPKSAIVSGPS